MTVAEGKSISFEYTLYGEDNEVIDASPEGESLTYTHGAGQIVPGLEKELSGMEVGDSKEVMVKPEEGYGEKDPSATIEVPKAQIPEAAQQVGSRLQSQNPEGQVLHSVVSEIKEETIVLDFNHPLAGKTLRFDVKITDIQDTAQ